MKNLIKIYSHPRSGTHFLEAFLAKNFYPDLDLASKGPIYYGHWSHKILLEEGEPYHQLFGSHFFPGDAKPAPKMIYIYRDGRAVIASIWNSKFYQKEWEGISFSEFLRKDIDWYGGLGQQGRAKKMNIVQHWYSHVEEWEKVRNDNLIHIRFEELKRNPNKIYRQITKKFFPFRHVKEAIFGSNEIDPISKKVGLKPNEAKINSWQKLFTSSDLDFFYSELPHKIFLDEN